MAKEKKVKSIEVSQEEKDEMFELIKILSESHSVSGRENEIKPKIKELIKDFVDKIREDEMGNLIARIGNGEKKIMIAAHMDEIGLMVKSIDDKGFLRFVKLGGIYDGTILNQRVVVHTKKGKVIGVIGSKPPHKMKREEMEKVIKAEEMFIDVGAESKKEAEEELNIEIGNWITIDRDVAKLGKNKATGKAFDDRVGCAVLVKLAKEMSKNKDKIKDKTIYLVFTVQEEVGLKGARTSTFEIDPDFAIAIDTNLPNDYPSADACDPPMKLGKGPAVTIIDASGLGIIVREDIVSFISNVAKKDEIPIQLDVSDSGTTDAAIINITKAGIPTATISVPARYIHTPVEVIDLRDVVLTWKLIYSCILNYSNNAGDE